MTPAINGDGQLGMDERVIDDAALVDALEKRLRANDDLAEVRTSFKAADKAARELLAKHDFADGEAVRVGRFRISRSFVEGGHRRQSQRANVPAGIGHASAPPRPSASTPRSGRRRATPRPVIGSASGRSPSRRSSSSRGMPGRCLPTLRRSSGAARTAAASSPGPSSRQ
jgi:hypothetical protein